MQSNQIPENIIELIHKNSEHDNLTNLKKLQIDLSPCHPIHHDGYFHLVSNAFFNSLKILNVQGAFEQMITKKAGGPHQPPDYMIQTFLMRPQHVLIVPNTLVPNTITSGLISPMPTADEIIKIQMTRTFGQSYNNRRLVFDLQGITASFKPDVWYKNQGFWVDPTSGTIVTIHNSHDDTELIWNINGDKVSYHAIIYVNPEVTLT